MNPDVPVVLKPTSSNLLIIVKSFMKLSCLYLLAFLPYVLIAYNTPIVSERYIKSAKNVHRWRSYIPVRLDT